VNAADINGFSPLHYACQLVSAHLVPQTDRKSNDRAQKRKALKDAQNLKVKWKIYWISLSQKINLVKLLLEYNSDVNARTKNDKKVPLQFAIDGFDPELIGVLIDNDRIFIWKIV